MDRLTTQENPQTIFRNNLNLCYNRKHDSFVCYIKASILFIIYISSIKFEKKYNLGVSCCQTKIYVFFEKISTQDYLGLQSDEFLIKVDFSLKSKKSFITSLQYLSITLPTMQCWELWLRLNRICYVFLTLGTYIRISYKEHV